ncbi:endonuclease [Oceanospirillaceae bacterium ASx5O]|nr:endonuclease [Oceanospirillaceae bacterium ASx5O]
MRVLTRLLLSTALTVFACSTQAFDFQGHALVCQMAYAQLSESVQKKVDALVAKSPEKHFSVACAWPDNVRDQKRYEHTKPWHFVNVPRSATSVSVSDCPKQGCLLSAITTMQQRLQKKPDTDWQALLFLGHFIADLHQPMHVSYFDDRGGNRTSVRFLGDKTNLHYLFDGDILGKRNFRQQAPQWLTTISAEQQQQWQQGDVLSWAGESLQITRTIYAQLPASHKIGSDYRDTFAPQLEQQMKKASVRLAFLLKKKLK